MSHYRLTDLQSVGPNSDTARANAPIPAPPKKPEGEQ